jgi:hypothetical protein
MKFQPKEELKFNHPANPPSIAFEKTVVQSRWQLCQPDQGFVIRHS